MPTVPQYTKEIRILSNLKRNTIKVDINILKSTSMDFFIKSPLFYIIIHSKSFLNWCSRCVGLFVLIFIYFPFLILKEMTKYVISWNYPKISFSFCSQQMLSSKMYFRLESEFTFAVFFRKEWKKQRNVSHSMWR